MLQRKEILTKYRKPLTRQEGLLARWLFIVVHKDLLWGTLNYAVFSVVHCTADEYFTPPRGNLMENRQIGEREPSR